MTPWAARLQTMIEFYFTPCRWILPILGPPVAALAWLSWAAWRRRDPPKRVRSFMLAIAGIALVALGCALYSIALPVAWECRISEARGQVERVGSALRKYAQAHDGELPDPRSWTVDLLREGLITDRRFFYLPVPLGSCDESRFPETDLAYGGHAGPAPTGRGGPENPFLLWTATSIPIRRVADYPWHHIRIVISRRFHVAVMSEEAFQTAIRGSSVPSWSGTADPSKDDSSSGVTPHAP